MSRIENVGFYEKQLTKIKTQLSFSLKKKVISAFIVLIGFFIYLQRKKITTLTKLKIMKTLKKLQKIRNLVSLNPIEMILIKGGTDEIKDPEVIDLVEEEVRDLRG